MFDEILLNFRMRSGGAKAYKSCRSRQEFSHEYYLARIGFDTAENGPQRLPKISHQKKLEQTEVRRLAGAYACPRPPRLLSLRDRQSFMTSWNIVLARIMCTVLHSSRGSRSVDSGQMHILWATRTCTCPLHPVLHPHFSTHFSGLTQPSALEQHPVLRLLAVVSYLQATLGQSPLTVVQN